MKTVVVCCIFLLWNVIYAKDLGTVGTTYPIAEKDMMTEIEERAASVDWKSIIAKEKENVKKTAAKADTRIPAADKNKTFYLDMTYMLDHDIHTYNTAGEITGILYPKGFIYNPLDYIKIKEIYVILNGNRKSEVEWFKNKYALSPLVYPLITEGDAIEVAESIGRPVYILKDNMKELFKIERTVSIVYPEGRKLRVDEIVVKNEKNHSKPSAVTKHK